MALVVGIGSYIGDGTDDRWISLPSNASAVVPRMIIAHNGGRAGSSGGVLYLDALGSSTWPIGIPGAAETGIIKAVAAGSFQIGTGSEINGSQVTYFYTAVDADDTILKTGSYFGDGTSDRDITGPGSAPDAIILARKNYGPVLLKIGQTGSEPNFLGYNVSSIGSDILYTNSTGFAVMNHFYTNHSFGSYYWAALWGSQSTLTFGSYFGDQTENRVIDLGSTSSSVWIKPDVGSQNVSTDLLNGLVAAYTFDGTGSDYFGSRHLAPGGGGGSFLNALVGSGLILGSQFKQNWNTSNYMRGSVMSLSGWFKEVVYPTPGYGRTFGFHGGSFPFVSQYLSLYHNNPAGTYSMRWIRTKHGIVHSHDIVVSGPAGSFPNDKWLHAVGTTNGTIAKFYLNGSLVGSAGTDLGNGANGTNAYNGFIVGRDNYTIDDSEHRYSSGSFDEVMVWDRALSEDECLTLYNAGSASRFPPSNETNIFKGLRAYYAFDGGLGSDAQGAYNATLVNATQTTSGFLGSAYIFDGTDDVILVPGSVVGNLPQGTINLWIKPNATTQSAMCAGSYDFTGHHRFRFQIQNGSTIRTIMGSSGNAFTWDQLVPTITTDTWHMMTMSWDGFRWTLYTNGSFRGGRYNTNTTSGSELGGSLGIGAAFHVTGGSAAFFTGSLDEMGIWSRPLNINEIKYLYDYGSGQRYPFTRNHGIYSSDIMETGSSLVTQGSQTQLSVHITALSGSGFIVGSIINE
ncbi:MAG: LamG-like jellyroll fold domain-containing protein [bacterium]|nr:LamG-like jellyroll fold domain-containing protein [bacterium]